MGYNDEEAPTNLPQQRFISRKIAEMYALIDQTFQELQAGVQVNEQVRSQLQSSVMTVAYAIRHHRDKEAIDWEALNPGEGDMDDLLRKQFRGVTQAKPKSGSRGGATQVSDEPFRMDAEELAWIGLDLLEAIDALGLGYKIDESTDTTYPDPV